MITLICGIPNAGKTTFSSRYDNVIHLDDYPNTKECNKAIARRRGDICVEGTYSLKEQRRQLLRSYRGRSPRVCIWIDTDVDECIAREHNYRKRSLALVHSHNKMFAPPTIDEGWDEIIVIRGNSNAHTTHTTRY